jgi:hypothetical protein
LDARSLAAGAAPRLSAPNYWPQPHIYPSMQRHNPVIIDNLSERQSRFVREYVERGGRPGAAADSAIAAGFADAREAAARAQVIDGEVVESMPASAPQTAAGTAN